MRIGLSTSVIQRGRTGIAQYVFSLLRSLLPLCDEHQVMLFVLEEDRSLFDFAQDSATIVTVAEKFRPPVRNIWWHQTELPRLARRHRLDVLHIPSYRRLLWSKPCSLVGTIHDLAPFQVKGKYDWKRMLYGRVVVKRLVKRQDQIIAVSQNTAHDIIRHFGIPADQITVIHNGIDHARFLPGDPIQAVTEVQKLFGIEAPFFLYLARLEHPGKNHVRLVQAFEKFKIRTGLPWKLVFGGSDWHGAEVIHAAIAKSKFPDDIRCLGFVPSNQLPLLYRAATTFVYPSLYEGFGLPPLEAMACGCPVICAGRGALAEVVGDAARIIDPENCQEIEDELVQFAMNMELREKYRANGLKQASQFQWPIAAKATLQIYHRAAGCHERGNGIGLARDPILSSAMDPLSADGRSGPER